MTYSINHDELFNGAQIIEFIRKIKGKEIYRLHYSKNNHQYNSAILKFRPKTREFKTLYLLDIANRNGGNESRWLDYFSEKEIGCLVPKLYSSKASANLRLGAGHYIIMEDIQRSSNLVEFVSKIIRQDALSNISDIEEALIHSTAKIIETGLADTDHTMINFLIQNETRKIYRIDFELMLEIKRLYNAKLTLSKMIAGLLSSYIYATQPNFPLFEQFYYNFRKRMIGLGVPIFKIAHTSIRHNLHLQHKLHGIWCNEYEIFLKKIT